MRWRRIRSQTWRDVSSELTDEDMAVWQRHLPSSQSPGDARYLRKPLTDLWREKKKRKKKETPKFMSNLQCGDRRSDGDFLRACTFIIQSDIHSIRYGSWRFCLIFMTDTKSRSNITNSGSKSISSSNEVQLRHCKSYLCFTWVFTFYAI